MIKRILLILDGSPQMPAAVGYTLNLARDLGSEILLYPLATKRASGSAAMVGEEWIGPVIRNAEKEGIELQVLSAAAASFKESLEWATSCDLTVLPPAIPDDVIRSERRLVLLLTAGGSAVMLPCTNQRSSRTVAIAWDGSVACARALKLHLQLFHRPHLHYLLLHIGGEPEAAEALLDRGGALIRAHGASVETLARSGKPAERLLEITASLKPDHLLLAPHWRRLLDKKRLGRTSRKMLQAGTVSLFMAV
ncbi:MAG TPA: universal stress protein [bacterium]|nr:universal stress protein [bacterium]HQG44217.1 universal stress protein [bacterium]HQI48808.1 universal stress protein [bacterium]HQJ66060.1 universal stress protein [bacterium]